MAHQAERKWVTDITGIKTAEGKLHLGSAQDLYSSVIVGRSRSRWQSQAVALRAVLMALWEEEDRTPVILHSGRGSQLTSGDYRRFLKKHKLTCSMGAVGSGVDGAPTERVAAQLKRDPIGRRSYQTRAGARTDVFACIERFHDPRMRQWLAGTESVLTQPPPDSG